MVTVEPLRELLLHSTCHVMQKENLDFTSNTQVRVMNRKQLSTNVTHTLPYQNKCAV